MERISKRALVNLADVDATHATSATYFPFPERVEKIAYSCGACGWTGSLYRGQMSGLLYAVTDCGNDCDTNGCGMRRNFGARELAVVETLARVEEVEGDAHGHARSVLRFVSRDGRSFTAATFDHGHTWTVCG